MSGIIPRSKAKGTDICAFDNFYYIIRSDLGCYMQTSDLNKGADISVFSLHPACQNGDHYIGGDSYFHIIKGNSYRRVTSLTTDSDAAVYSLHPKCQGGDHYFAACGYFYIIFQETGIYRRTKNMTNLPEENTLHPNFKNGLYYWGPPYCKKNGKPTEAHLSCCNFLKPASEGIVEFCSSKLSNGNGPDLSVYSVHPDVLNFLPGGLSVNKGSAIGMWENITAINNDSNTPVTWQKRITKKWKMTQITHNWKIDSSASIESGELAKLIAKLQFSFPAKYGGLDISTVDESWKDATEEEEHLTFVLKPNERLYLWQRQLCLGQEPVLFCCDLKITNEQTLQLHPHSHEYQHFRIAELQG